MIGSGQVAVVKLPTSSAGGSAIEVATRLTEAAVIAPIPVTAVQGAVVQPMREASVTIRST